jgi:hypothetical protein
MKMMTVLLQTTTAPVQAARKALPAPAATTRHQVTPMHFFLPAFPCIACLRPTDDEDEKDPAAGVLSRLVSQCGAHCLFTL